MASPKPVTPRAGAKGAPKMTVRVSPNVTVRSATTGRDTISAKEQARLSAINKPAKTTAKASSVKATAKASTKALKNINTPSKSTLDPRGKANVKALKVASKRPMFRGGGAGIDFREANK